MTAQRKIKPQINAKLETISPSEARQILEGNENNRRLNMDLVNFYQKQMVDGRWQINGDMIRIDEDGYLLDGQHRLTACARSGIPLTTYVIRGLSNQTFKTIDCGKSRSPSDYLKIDGKTGNLNILAAAARLVMNFDKETGFYRSSVKRVSPAELIYFLDNHTGLTESVKFSERLKPVTSQSVAAGCHYIFSLVDPESAHAFFEALATGAGLTKANPALTVRNRLITLRTDRRAGSGYQKMIVAYLVQAFNYFRMGKQLHNSVFHPDSEIVLNDLAGAMR
jgi:hypothetical protein